MSHGDKRQHLRIETKAEVSYMFGSECFNETILNISQGGIFIKTDNPLQMDDNIEIKFTLPNIDRALKVMGQVKWIKRVENEEGPPGMGLQFTSIGEEENKLLVQFIAWTQLSPQKY